MIVEQRKDIHALLLPLLCGNDGPARARLEEHERHEIDALLLRDDPRPERYRVGAPR